ncbi:MAG: vanadium-dependent haloperoxidase [Gemmatimonadetes bacterium]|nr:vanadium-dependent haloperoxidase [Gemmatimonadota bacterium]
MRTPDLGRGVPRRCHAPRARWSRHAGALLAALALGGGCAAPPPPDGRMVAEWLSQLYGVMRAERLSPPVASRMAAYAAVALYAGLAEGDTALPPVRALLPGGPSLSSLEAERDNGRPPETPLDATLVAVAAERAVLDALLAEGLPTTRAAVARLADSLVAARRAVGVPSPQAEAALARGRAIGEAVAAWAATDGFAASRGRPWRPPAGAAMWVNDAPVSDYATHNLSAVSELVRPDNPANRLAADNTDDRGLILSRPKAAAGGTLPAANMAGATEPYWHTQRPFVLTAWDACPLPPPPAYGTAADAPLRAQARAVWETSRRRTPADDTVAYYWADNAGETGTPVGHWLAIVAQVIRDRDLSASAAARLALGTAVAQADAFIAAWGYKYTFNLLRPRTYIRRVLDPAWEPLIPTPPFPEYPAGHATQSAAAAAVLTAELGAMPFVDRTSVAIGHAPRRFPSFEAAAEEAGRSRVLAGVHFPAGNEAGRQLGRCVGEAVAARLQGGAP